MLVIQYLNTNSGVLLILGDDKATTELELGESATIIETNARLEYTFLRLDPLYIKVTCWTYLAIMYVVPYIALLLFNVRYVLKNKLQTNNMNMILSRLNIQNANIP